MSIEQLRAKVIGSIWQAIANRVDCLPFHKTQKKWSADCRWRFGDHGRHIGEICHTSPEDRGGRARERVLWKGDLLSLLRITRSLRGLKINTAGFQTRGEFELIRIQDIDSKQGWATTCLASRCQRPRPGPSNPESSSATFQTEECTKPCASLLEAVSGRHISRICKPHLPGSGGHYNRDPAR